ncbi:MAG: hypothetical protein D4Q77_01035 [Methanothrix sp.]|nr:MAG: hypothetical protein D4Q77_01035 [Methanothrix sp.]
MKISGYTYLLVGLSLVIGACGLIPNQDPGFCTDGSILTMTLPEKEGFDTTPDFVLEAKLPDVPDTLGIYALKSPDVTRAYAVGVAGAKGAKGEVQDQGSNYVILNEEQYVSVEKASGAETLFLDYKNAFGDPEKGLPNADVMKRNADAYSSQNRLLPDGYRYAGMSFLTRQQLSEKGPTGRAENVMGIAKYSRTLEGLPVEGAGSTVTVLLGDGGQVQGYTKVSRNIGQRMAVASTTPGKADRTYELLVPDEAFNLLQEKGLTTEIANVDKAVVTDVHLAYYETSGDERQDVTVPIYVFSGYATGPDGQFEFQEYMYALKTKAGSTPFQKPDRSKAVDRSSVQVPGKGMKDEESRMVSTIPLREVSLAPHLSTGPLKQVT